MRMNMLFLLSAQAFDSSLLEDVKFYVILAVLAAALIAIIVIFARWDKFKAKKKEVELSKRKDIVPELIIIEDGKKSRVVTSDIKDVAQETE